MRVPVSDRCLVDTDVVSYLFRGDTRAERYRPYLAGERLAISFMTVGELERWVLQREWGQARRASMEAYLRQFTIYLADRKLCRLWAEVSYGARRRGRPIQTADAWIAATALGHDLPLVSHNVSDYAGVDGLIIVSESTPSDNETPGAS